MDALPLINQSKRMTNPSDRESRAIISTFEEFVAFMRIVRGYVGGENVGVIVLLALLNTRPRETRVNYNKVYVFGFMRKRAAKQRLG